MKKPWTIAMLAALMIPATVTLSGCELWFGQGQCDYGNGDGDQEANGLLNPYTGQCEYYYGGGGGNTCGDYGGANDLAPLPDWGQCLSTCTGLDEETCLATAGCRAGYLGDCPEGFDCDGTTYTFYECWEVSPAGPVQGDCNGLDAYECSLHDDCVAHHYPAGENFEAPGIGNFGYCVAEVARGPNCSEPVDCAAAPPDCPAGTVPGRQDGCWTGDCIAFADCDPPLDVGLCYDEVFCDSLPPDCPADSVPGVSDGCWSGYCIPLTDCEAQE